MSDQDKLAEEKALEHARALGCNCEPDISYRMVGGSIMHLSIAHDDTCALMSGDAPASA